jgi:putative ubiquitin-RnfH superfamily antitoxin RatB of RatAB toxin-antitoxin module
MAREPIEVDKLIRVCVVASWQAGQVAQEWLDLPLGSPVRDALGLSHVYALWQEHCPELPMPALGVWAHKVQPSTLLHAGDRLEIYRPLRVDPKVARRERFQKQGARSTGLFAKRRPGAKPGY